MEIWNHIVCIIALLLVFSTIKLMLKKKVKSVKVKFTFVDGFEFVCSFYDDTPKRK